MHIMITSMDMLRPLMHNMNIMLNMHYIYLYFDSDYAHYAYSNANYAEYKYYAYYAEY